MTRLTPEKAVEQYLKAQHDLTQSTLTNHRYRLGKFLDFCETKGVRSMSEITGMHCEEFKNWRVEQGLKLVTLQYHMQTLRKFLRWCEGVGAVEAGLSENVMIPKVDPADKARDDHISHETASEIIDFLCKYHWASKEHLIIHVLYHTGIRRSSLHSLDVEDWNSEEGYLAVRHRPHQGTSLKLKAEGERNISVADERLAQALDDWVTERRPDVEDEYGRQPLLATSHGRMHFETISKVCYRVTRPCFYAGFCPHEKDIETCEWTRHDQHSKCPSSISSHPIRRSSITHHLDSDVPKEIVSERMNVSQKVLDQHYDARDYEQKRENRRKYLGDV
ncbi:Phage integrase family protein [Halogranum amylolyticum]|uniref:Phage integrase family protein n=1 Tax=Halogranum amylolyticum TaxID=660520 RepID=A0A1H8QDG7_9EURY|nr:site-specific integrase [Halogranum amylolyticum]SEO52096.1 Phage integrase family protein [Halogranum amylolyticum]